jgi:hypothetical protein
MPNFRVLPPIELDDVVGRGVFSARRAKRARNNKISHDIFLEKPGVSSLSVDRLNHAPDETVAEISDRIALGRPTPSGKPSEFFGWATKTVEHVPENGRSVQETPKLDNIFHADIYLNIQSGPEMRDLEKQHANELAAGAKWRGRPIR